METPNSRSSPDKDVVQHPGVVLSSTALDLSEQASDRNANEPRNIDMHPDAAPPPPYYLRDGDHLDLLGTEERGTAGLGGDAATTEPKSTKITGLTLKRNWIIILGITVAVVIIAGVVGGVLGSRARDFDVEFSASTPTSSGSPTATPSAANRYANVVAAVETTDGKDPAIQVFYQRTDADAWFYHTTSNDGVEFHPEKHEGPGVSVRNMTTAMMSRLDESGNSILYLFVLNRRSGNTGYISKPAFRCGKDLDICIETRDEAIGEITQPPHVSSGLAALWLGGSYARRVYYHDEYGYLVEVSGDGEYNLGWKSSRIGPRAAIGSRIAAALAPGPKISIMYSDADTHLPAEVVYDGTWKSPVLIDSASPEGWNASAPMSACYVPTPDTIHFYYMSITTGSINEYTRSGLNGTWKRSGTSSTWLKPESGIAAIGWLDQARLYYRSGGVLKQNVMNNGTWTEVGTIS